MDPVTISLAAFGFTIITAAATLGGAFAVINWRTAHLENENESLRSDMTALRQVVHSNELEAARKFVTEDTLTKLENKVLAAIDRLADRLDKIIDGQVRS